MTPERSSYRCHRFPAKIISHVVWLYHVFSLNLRDIELILAERGVAVTHESIRHWCKKFGEEFAVYAGGDPQPETPGIWMKGVCAVACWLVGVWCRMHINDTHCFSQPRPSKSLRDDLASLELILVLRGFGL